MTTKQKKIADLLVETLKGKLRKENCKDLEDVFFYAQIGSSEMLGSAALNVGYSQGVVNNITNGGDYGMKIWDAIQEYVFERI